MIFADKNRLIFIGVTTALILMGCFYGSWRGPQEDPAPRVRLENSANSKEVIAIQYAKVISISEKQLELKAMGFEFTAVFPDPVTAQTGNDISLTGIAETAEQLRVLDYHIHPWRPLKYYISLPAIALVIYILLKKYKFNWRRLIFMEK